MPIDNVSAGQLIDPDWGNDVADQLNNLPEVVQHGILTGTTGTGGLLTSESFPEAFGATPTVTATVVTSASTQQDTAQTNAVNASAVQFRIMRNGTNVGSGVSVTVHWAAFGVAA